MTTSANNEMGKIMERFSGAMNWTKCAKCEQDWSAHSLNESRICPDCLKKDRLDAKELARRELALFKFMGGQEDMEDFEKKRVMERFKFENFRVTDGVKKGYDACLNFKPTRDNLFLWGPCGRGKSHLAHAAARTHILAGKVAITIKPPALGRKFRMISDSEYEEKMRGFVFADILIIDELGLGKETEKYLETLYDVIDRRDTVGQNGLIITSNLSLANFAEKNNDDRLPSRVIGLMKTRGIIKMESAVDWRTVENGGELNFGQK